MRTRPSLVHACVAAATAAVTLSLATGCAYLRGMAADADYRSACTFRDDVERHALGAFPDGRAVPPWDSFYVDDGGSGTVLETVPGLDKGGVRGPRLWEASPSPTVDGRSNARLAKGGVAKLGTDQFYAFALLVPRDFTPPSSYYMPFELGQRGIYVGGPNFDVEIDANGGLTAHGRSGTATSEDSEGNPTFNTYPSGMAEGAPATIAPRLARDVWHQVVIRIRHHYLESEGIVQIWHREHGDDDFHAVHNDDGRPGWPVLKADADGDVYVDDTTGEASQGVTWGPYTNEDGVGEKTYYDAFAICPSLAEAKQWFDAPRSG